VKGAGSPKGDYLVELLVLHCEQLTGIYSSRTASLQKVGVIPYNLLPLPIGGFALSTEAGVP
jgi:hypothetical protein